MTLLGRRAECEALDWVLADALAGRSRIGRSTSSSTDGSPWRV
jgi:hypothetical protein